MQYEYHRASIRHLWCMNVLTYARICGPVSMRYRSDQVKLVFSTDTDTNVYNFMVVC